MHKICCRFFSAEPGRSCELKFQGTTSNRTNGSYRKHYRSDIESAGPDQTSHKKRKVQKKDAELIAPKLSRLRRKSRNQDGKQERQRKNMENNNGAKKEWKTREAKSRSIAGSLEMKTRGIPLYTTTSFEVYRDIPPQFWRYTAIYGRRFRGTAASLEILPQVSRYRRKSRGAAASLEITPQVSRYRRKSRDPAASVEVPLQVSRSRRKCRGTAASLHVPPQVSRYRRKCRGIARSLEVPPEVSKSRKEKRKQSRKEKRKHGKQEKKSESMENKNSKQIY